jgi:hypothetical protein
MHHGNRLLFNISTPVTHLHIMKTSNFRLSHFWEIQEYVWSIFMRYFLIQLVQLHTQMLNMLLHQLIIQPIQVVRQLVLEHFTLTVVELMVKLL